MKFSKPFMSCCLIFMLSSLAVSSQNYLGELINESITLNSNSRSKSAIVTNLPEYGQGDSSQFLIAASWLKNGTWLECRSLLKFDYTNLPEFLLKDPSLIQSAELILYPVNTNLTIADLNTSGRIIVKQIIENWDGALTIWNNQPAIDSSAEVVWLIKKRQIENSTNIDVTKLVSNMLLSGNNGFLICPEDSSDQLSAIKMYASPTYKNANLRPQLVINYMQPATAADMKDSFDSRFRYPRTQVVQGNSSVQPTIRVISTGGN